MDLYSFSIVCGTDYAFGYTCVLGTTFELAKRTVFLMHNTGLKV